MLGDGFILGHDAMSEADLQDHLDKLRRENPPNESKAKPSATEGWLEELRESINDPPNQTFEAMVIWGSFALIAIFFFVWVLWIRGRGILSEGPSNMHRIISLLICLGAVGAVLAMLFEAAQGSYLDAEVFAVLFGLLIAALIVLAFVWKSPLPDGSSLISVWVRMKKAEFTARTEELERK